MAAAKDRDTFSGSAKFVVFARDLTPVFFKVYEQDDRGKPKPPDDSSQAPQVPKKELQGERNE